jgi:hypothetical protein
VNRERVAYVVNESNFSLEPLVKAQLEQALGKNIPDPNSPEFQDLLEDLLLNNPALFEDMMCGLIVHLPSPKETSQY